VGAGVADQDETQTPVEPDRPVELGHVKPEGKTGLYRLLRQIPDQDAPDSSVSIF